MVAAAVRRAAWLVVAHDAIPFRSEMAASLLQSYWRRRSAPEHPNEQQILEPATYVKVIPFNYGHGFFYTTWLAQLCRLTR